MCDCQDTRPSKMQRIEGEASDDVKESHVAVDSSSAVSKPARSENAALQGAQPFSASRYADSLSNVSNFKIIESTLRGTCIKKLTE